MSEIREQTIKKLDALKLVGVFDLLQAKDVGLSAPTLARLVKSGRLIKLGHGFYVHPESMVVEIDELDYIVACTHFGPKSFIGGLTALFHYGLITNVPKQIWVVVPPETKTKSLRYRCLRSKHNLEIGVNMNKSYRISSLERSIVEAFVYQSKIGLRTAYQAWRTALSQNLTDQEKLYDMAKALQLETKLLKYWESIRDDRFD